MPSTTLLAVLCFCSATADYAIQQLFPDDACTEPPSARVVFYDGCVPRDNGTSSIAITCTPSGYNMTSYSGGTCSGAPSGPPFSLAASPCANSGQSLTCVSGRFTFPTSAALVRANYGSDVTSCPIPSGGIPTSNSIFDTGRCVNFAPALLLQPNAYPASVFLACNPGGVGLTVTKYNARDCQQANPSTQNATGCEVESGSLPQVSFTTCYDVSAGGSASSSAATSASNTATPSETPFPSQPPPFSPAYCRPAALPAAATGLLSCFAGSTGGSSPVAPVLTEGPGGVDYCVSYTFSCSVTDSSPACAGQPAGTKVRNFTFTANATAAQLISPASAAVYLDVYVCGFNGCNSASASDACVGSNPSYSFSFSFSNTPSNTPAIFSSNGSDSQTATPTKTPVSNTPSNTPAIFSSTGSDSQTATQTKTPLLSDTPSSTPSTAAIVSSSSQTPTNSETASGTASGTPSSASTLSTTPTPTPTPSAMSSPSDAASDTPSSASTLSATPTASGTSSPTSDRAAAAPTAAVVVSAELATPSKPFCYKVTTLAGNGTSGFQEGTGVEALFRIPMSVAVLDLNGTLVLTDYNNHRIRKLTTGGAVSTIAGSGACDPRGCDYGGNFADGTGVDASFNYPFGVTLNVNGTIFVADNGNNRIRQIAPNGAVTTLAGNGTAASADGTGTGALLFSPTGIAVDFSGIIVFAELRGNRVRKVTPGGVVTTLAGSGNQYPAVVFADGAGAAASFFGPIGVTIDSSGTVYVADSGNHRIRKVTLDGFVTTFAGDGWSENYTGRWVDGTGTSASFSMPFGVGLDPIGNLIVADYGNHRIRKVTPVGVVSTLAGNGACDIRGCGYGGLFFDGAAADSSFSFPASVAVDSRGIVSIADSGNHRIRVLKCPVIGPMSAAAGGLDSTSIISGLGGGLGAAFLLTIAYFFFRRRSRAAAVHSATKNPAPSGASHTASRVTINPIGVFSPVLPPPPPLALPWRSAQKHFAGAPASTAESPSCETSAPPPSSSSSSPQVGSSRNLVSSALKAAAHAAPFGADVALQLLAALLDQVEKAERVDADAHRLRARLGRLRTLVAEVANDAAFVERHGALFDSLLATLRAAEAFLARLCAQASSRMRAFFTAGANDVELTALEEELTMRLQEFTLALQATTLTAARGAAAASVAAPVAPPPFSMCLSLADFELDPPLSAQLATAPRGTFGVVVFGTWAAYQRPVAIKLLSGIGERGIHAWLGEAELMRRLSTAGAHGSARHVVQLFGIGVDDPYFLVVMERMAGGSLRATLDDFRTMGAAPPLAVALRWAADAARGIAECHAQRVVHADVKAANTLLANDGGAKLGDLGSARVTRGIAATATRGATHGAARGSILWNAPELLEDLNVAPSAASDVYVRAAIATAPLFSRNSSAAIPCASVSFLSCFHLLPPPPPATGLGHPRVGNPVLVPPLSRCMREPHGSPGAALRVHGHCARVAAPRLCAGAPRRPARAAGAHGACVGL